MLKRAKPLKRGIRWTSTPLSADRGEVSVLAIVETIAATSISLFIAWYWETLAYIVGSASLALLLLLRTRRSTALAMRFMGRYAEFFEELFSRYTCLWTVFIAALSVPFWEYASKFLSIIISFFLTPIASLSSIQFNW